MNVFVNLGPTGKIIALDLTNLYEAEVEALQRMLYREHLIFTEYPPESGVASAERTTISQMYESLQTAILEAKQGR